MECNLLSLCFGSRNVHKPPKNLNRVYKTIDEIHSKDILHRLSVDREKTDIRLVGKYEHQYLSQKFSNILKEAFPDNSSESVDKETLRKCFKKSGCMHFDSGLFDRLFLFFDTNNDGFVDKHEFLLTGSFFSKCGTEDITRTAFCLFDTDGNGQLSKTEFNQMINAIFSNTLADVLNTKEGSNLFKAHMANEWSLESLVFFEAVHDIVLSDSTKNEKILKQAKSKSVKSRKLSFKSYKTKEDNIKHCGSISIPIEEAQVLYDTHIDDNAPQQINISFETTVRIKKEFENARKNNRKTIEIENIKEAALEVFELMERDNYQRFKKKFLQNQIVDFAEVAWKQVGNQDGDNFTIEHFRKWTELNSGYFVFLENFVEQIQKWAELEEGADMQKLTTEPNLVCLLRQE